VSSWEQHAVDAQVDINRLVFELNHEANEEGALPIDFVYVAACAREAIIHLYAVLKSAQRRQEILPLEAPPGFVELENAKTLARRQALRDALEAVAEVRQANRGEREMILRKDALVAVQSLSANPLCWGGIHLEESPCPANGTKKTAR